MLRMSKRKSRVLAGLLAFVLVLSNVAANVQTVYAFGGFPLHKEEDGSVTVGGYEEESDADAAEGDAAEEESAADGSEEDYDFLVDIWPEYTEDEETGEREYTGGWQAYEYVNSGSSGDESWTLGQALLLFAGKYKEQYGSLEPDLPGVWAGDHDDVMEVRPDGTALVKDEGYVNVTFTYEAPDEEEAEAEDGAEAENGAEAEDGAARPGQEKETGEEAEKDTGEETGEETGDEPEDEIGDKPEEKIGDKAEGETEEETSEETGNGTESKTEGEIEEETSEKTGNLAENKTEGEIEEGTEGETIEAGDKTEGETERETAAGSGETMEVSQKKLADGAVLASSSVAEKSGQPSGSPQGASSKETGDPTDSEGGPAKGKEGGEAADEEGAGPADEEDSESADGCLLEDGTVLEWVVKVKNAEPETLALDSAGIIRVLAIPGRYKNAKQGLSYSDVTENGQTFSRPSGLAPGTNDGNWETWPGKTNVTWADHLAFGRKQNVTFAPGTIISTNEQVNWGEKKTSVGDDISSSYVSLHYNGATGMATYCIEPGVVISNAEAMKPIWESKKPYDKVKYFSDYRSYSGLSGNELSRMLARVLQFGYQGKVVDENDDKLLYPWVSSPNDAQKVQNAKDDLAKVIATQILMWETVVGERDGGFNHVDPPEGCDKVFESLVLNESDRKNPIYDEITTAYNAIVHEVQLSYQSEAPDMDVEDGSNVSNRWKQVEDGEHAGQWQLVLTDRNGHINDKYSDENDGYTIRAYKDSGSAYGDELNVERRGQDCIVVYAEAPCAVVIEITWRKYNDIIVYSSKTENYGTMDGKQDIAELDSDTKYACVLRLKNDETEVCIDPSVTKTVTGDARPSDHTFTFELTEAESNPLNGATLPHPSRVSLTFGKDETSKSVSFGKIIFNKEGKYEFYITELAAENDGYTYDKTKWTVRVKVERDDQGNLKKPEVSYLKDDEELSLDLPLMSMLFTNTYKVTGASYAPQISKVIEGGPLPDSVRDATFRFRIQAADTNPDLGAVMPEQTEITTVGVEVKRFDPIQFQKAGTYRFTVTEVPGEEIPGLSYDSTVWNLTVEVEDRGGTLAVTDVKYEKQTSGGEMHNGYPDMSWTIPDEAADTAQSPSGYATFVNTYEVKDVKLNLKVKKQISAFTSDGKESDAAPSEDQRFTFRLALTYATVLNGAKLPDPATATVKGEGTAEFGAIQFTKAGDYVFSIDEQKEEKPGYAYDPGSWSVEVHVVDDQGHLKIGSFDENGKFAGSSPVYSHGVVWGEDADGNAVAVRPAEDAIETNTEAAVFDNRYTVTETSYAPVVKKTVKGEPLEEEEFYFTMERGADNDADGYAFAEGESGRKASVRGAGTAAFGGITFKKAGTYTFEIKETGSNSPFWEDDARTWTLTVVVEDHDSKLEVTGHTYVSSGESSEVSDENAAFENAYHGPGDLSLVKTVSGSSGEQTRAFEFTVKLTGPNGEPLDGTYDYVGSSTVEGVEAPAGGTLKDGELTVTLIHGQKLTIKGVPEGTTYRITETEADQYGYSTSVEIDGNGQSGNTASGETVLDAETVVEYLNYRSYLPSGDTPSGDTPSGDTPSGDTPSGDTPSGDTPSGNTPSGGTPGPGPAPMSNRTSAPYFEIIADQPAPLSAFNGLENIEDEDVPLAFLAPVTGDEKPVGAAALFALLALGMMGAFGILGWKKNEKDQ